MSPTPECGEGAEELEAADKMLVEDRNLALQDESPSRRSLAKAGV